MNNTLIADKTAGPAALADTERRIDTERWTDHWGTLQVGGDLGSARWGALQVGGCHLSPGVTSP